MTQTWIVFSVNNQKVHQMNYNGHLGQDVVDATKMMVAGEHRVSERDVKVSFEDELDTRNQKKDTRVSSELVKVLKDELKKIERKN